MKSLEIASASADLAPGAKPDIPVALIYFNLIEGVSIEEALATLQRPRPGQALGGGDHRAPRARRPTRRASITRTPGGSV